MIALRKPHSKRDWFVLFAGALLVWFSGIPLVMGLQSYSWPKVPGVVTYSTSYQHLRISRVDIRYQYTYQQQQYTGDRYRFQFWMTRDQMRTWQIDAAQARYKVGEPVNVAVNPNDPAQAVLEPGIEDASFLWPAFGLLLLLVAFLDPRKQPAVAPPVAPPARHHSTANFLLIAGLAVLAYGSTTLYTAWSSLSWPTADGTILDSKFHTAGNNYRTQLWYEYHVGGARFVSENYHVGGNATPFKSTASAVAKRYPVGSAAKVYYNPSDPPESVLEPGPWFGNFVFPAIGLVILLVAWVAKKIAEVSVSPQKPRN